MWRFIRTWWLLGWLYKVCRDVSGEMDTKKILQDRAWVVKDNFINFLAEKSVKRCSKILWWRKKANKDSLNKRIYDYNSIIRFCIYGNEKYIEYKQDDSKRVYIATTHLADGFKGWFPLGERLLSEYKLLWVLIIIPILTGIYAPNIIKGFIQRFI